MEILLLFLTFFSLSRGAVTNCNQDNCLRALEHNSIAASRFCDLYKSQSYFSSSLPTWASHCSSSAPRVSSACSCFIAATSSSTTLTLSGVPRETPSASTPSNSCPAASASTIYVTLPPVTTQVYSTITLPASSYTEIDTVTSTTNVTPPPSTVTYAQPAVTITVYITSVVTDTINQTASATVTITAPTTVTYTYNPVPYTAFPIVTNSPSCVYFGAGGLEAVNFGYGLGWGPDDTVAATTTCEKTCYNQQCSYFNVYLNNPFAGIYYWYCFTWPEGSVYDSTEFECSPGYAGYLFNEIWSGV